jgi:hypothetical protein
MLVELPQLRPGLDVGAAPVIDRRSRPGGERTAGLVGAGGASGGSGGCSPARAARWWPARGSQLGGLLPGARRARPGAREWLVGAAAGPGGCCPAVAGSGRGLGSWRASFVTQPGVSLERPVAAGRALCPARRRGGAAIYAAPPQMRGEGFCIGKGGTALSDGFTSGRSRSTTRGSELKAERLGRTFVRAISPN